MPALHPPTDDHACLHCKLTDDGVCLLCITTGTMQACIANGLMVECAHYIRLEKDDAHKYSCWIATSAELAVAMSPYLRGALHRCSACHRSHVKDA